jgi:hypothetical protein
MVDILEDNEAHALKLTKSRNKRKQGTFLWKTMPQNPATSLSVQKSTDEMTCWYLMTYTQHILPHRKITFRI